MAQTKTKTQIKNWILKNCINDDGYVDLSNIDFEDIGIDLSKIKAKFICNNFQEAKNEIYNAFQEGYEIYNGYQKAFNEIYNGYQKSKLINNWHQKAFNEIYNGYQKSEDIFNWNQNAKLIYNTKKEGI